MFATVYNYRVKDYDWIKIEDHELRFPGLMYDIQNKILIVSNDNILDFLRKISENLK